MVVMPIDFGGNLAIICQFLHPVLLKTRVKRLQGRYNLINIAIERWNMQSSILLGSEEVARRAEKLYDEQIRQEVEREENIGKMVIIDIETGDYAVDKMGLESARQLRKKNPNGRFFGIRIGYKVAAAIGGVMERVSE
jgi:hypothetical protein